MRWLVILSMVGACRATQPATQTQPAPAAKPAAAAVNRPVPGAAEQQAAPSIGTATMRADRAIVLRLRAESGTGAIGDAQTIYLPGDPQYDEILRHVGGLQVGEEKPVPPWPDAPR